MPLWLGWHLAVWIFCVDYLGKTHETTPSGFDRGGGGEALAPVLSYGEAWALAGSHPSNGDSGSTQILTQHFSVQSQTVSQLTELRNYAL
jgi:hypothetical protein